MLGRINQATQASKARRDAVGLSELLQADELTAAEISRVRELIALNEIEIGGNLARGQLLVPLVLVLAPLVLAPLLLVLVPGPLLLARGPLTPCFCTCAMHCILLSMSSLSSL